MKLGIFAKTFDALDAQTALTRAREAGYEAVQYNMACSGIASLPTEISGEVARAVGRAMEDTGVGIAAVSATYNMIHPNPAERERGRRSFRTIAAAAHRMGTDLITLCTGTRDPADAWRFHPDNADAAAWGDLCKEFELLLPIAEQFDVALGVEPELANVVSSAQKARQLLDTFKTERIRIVFDAANLLETASAGEQRLIIESAAGLLAESIALAHAKDRRADGGFVAAGKGVLDYRHYLGVLRKSGFDGCLIAHGLDATEAHGVASFLRRNLAAAE